MNTELAVDIFKTTILFALYVVAPFLGVTLVVGLLTSLLQTVTSLQEPTLTFAPKLLALAGAVLLLTPWLLRAMSEFTISFITRMGTLGH
jgi:flagellar biosynthetic protein FliQ